MNGVDGTYKEGPQEAAAPAAHGAGGPGRDQEAGLGAGGPQRPAQDWHGGVGHRGLARRQDLRRSATMTTTRKPKTHKSATLNRAVTIPDNEPAERRGRLHPAFGTLGRDVDLAVGVLIAEDAAGAYEIVEPVSTINEALELAGHDLARRLKDLERGGAPLCPDISKVWSRDYDGRYALVYEISPANL